MPKGSQSTLRQQLTQVWKATGEQPQELADAPAFPSGVRYLWDWFCELQVSTDKVVSFTEIQAWSTLTGKVPTPAEVQALRGLSKDFISTQSHG